MTLRNEHPRVQRIVPDVAIVFFATLNSYKGDKKRLFVDTIVQRKRLKQPVKPTAKMGLGFEQRGLESIGFEQANILQRECARSLELPHTALQHLDKGDGRAGQSTILVIHQG